MQYALLGNTDLKVSRTCFGCYTMGGTGWGKVDDQQSIKAVRAALDLGVNFFDTADFYGMGHSEALLAKTLGPRLKDQIICTKFGIRNRPDHSTYADLSAQWLATCVEGSLKRLKLDFLHLYLMHRPDPNTPLAETISALEKLKSAGKILHYGFSNFSSSQVQECLEFGRVEAGQFHYNYIHREAESDLIPLCTENKIATLTYSPLLRGILSGKFTKQTKFGSDDARSRHPDFVGKQFSENLKLAENIINCAKKIGKTPSQVAVRWILNNPQITSVIVGARTAENVKENLDCFEDFPELEFEKQM
jgi:myo-inositol catabolism protein IolS